MSPIPSVLFRREHIKPDTVESYTSHGVPSFMFHEWLRKGLIYCVRYIKTPEGAELYWYRPR